MPQYQLLENGVFREDFFASRGRTVGIEVYLYDEKGALVYFNSAHDQYYLAIPQGEEYLRDQFLAGYAQEWMRGGRFRAVATVTLHNGEEKTVEKWFEVR